MIMIEWILISSRSYMTPACIKIGWGFSSGSSPTKEWNAVCHDRKNWRMFVRGTSVRICFNRTISLRMIVINTSHVSMRITSIKSMAFAHISILFISIGRSVNYDAIQCNTDWTHGWGSIYSNI
jgi:hypothetical protein